MSGRVYIGPNTSGASAPEVFGDLLQAADELERQLDAEPGIVLRQLTEMLRKQIEFRELQQRYDRRSQLGISSRSPS